MWCDPPLDAKDRCRLGLALLTDGFRETSAPFSGDEGRCGGATARGPDTLAFGGEGEAVTREASILDFKRSDSETGAPSAWKNLG